MEGNNPHIIYENEIKDDICKEFQKYPRDSILGIIEKLMKEKHILRMYSFSGWWVIYKKNAITKVNELIENRTKNIKD
jgi:hypothetical protein